MRASQIFVLVRLNFEKVNYYTGSITPLSSAYERQQKLIHSEFYEITARRRHRVMFTLSFRSGDVKHNRELVALSKYDSTLALGESRR